MDRHALFVDAGYALASGGLLCLNTGKRDRVGCDIETLLSALVARTSATASLPILRTYWYDASWGAVPTFEQALVAELPSVKLRLGRLARTNNLTVQKGVDSLLVTDLMTLSQERAISSAFLMTGDEDIRAGVVACQALGVRLTLIGVEGRTPNEFTQADTLLSEADGNLMLDAGVLAAHFSRRLPLPREIDGAAIFSGLGAAASPVNCGHAFGASWSANLTPFELRRLKARRPRIPKPVDVMIIQAFGGLLPPRSSADLRQGFWDGVDQVHP